MGKFPVGCIIRIPIGAYGSGGPYHSGCIESSLLPIRGIKIAYPSNGADLKGLMKAAYLDPNPVVMFEHKGLYWSKVPGTSYAMTVEPDENYIVPFVGGGTGLFRDMAFAKGLLWGVNTTNQIFGVDTATKTIVKTITCTGAATLRAITWDPYRQGFWVGTTSFTGPLVCVDTNGVNIPGASITTPASGLYGAGYENNGSQATSFIWISTDASPANATQTALVKYNAQTLAVVGSAMNITVPLQTPAATLASGGGEVVTNLIPGKKTWVGVVQSGPDRLIV
ncbi:unnamed protein product, partial [Rotaria sp. Silwood1]